MIVIDRIEGDLAVLVLEGTTIEVPVAALPEGSHEGAVLRLVLDADAEDRTRAENEARLTRLRARSPMKGGVLDL